MVRGGNSFREVLYKAREFERMEKKSKNKVSMTNAQLGVGLAKPKGKI